jgi:hypothetical protein
LIGFELFTRRHWEPPKHKDAMCIRTTWLASRTIGTCSPLM